VYVSELTYGGFTRVVPLPPGAITDNAKATFRDGVLEIVVPAPSQEARRGRRLEIQQGPKERNQGGPQHEQRRS
jgi:HSP20 family protein